MRPPYAVLAIAFVSAGLSPARAYSNSQSNQGIEWSRDVAGGIALAKKADRPLMFYIVGPTDDRPDSEKDQRRSFRDPRVLAQARRFVPVRISRSQHQAELRQWGMSPNSNLDIVFTRPDGSKIDQISAGGAGIPDSFAQKMAMVFRQYRDEVFQQKIKPVLDRPDADARELKLALDKIVEFMILSADGAVAALLDREKLEPAVKADVFKTLAKLSTPPTVDALLKAAHAGDRNALSALDDCTPEAAERILVDVGSTEAAKHLLAYKTVTKICRIRNAKPDKFWESTNERVKNEELERVRNEVRRVAGKWKEQNEWR